jgi:hypothetical protein
MPLKLLLPPLPEFGFSVSSAICDEDFCNTVDEVRETVGVSLGRKERFGGAWDAMDDDRESADAPLGRDGAAAGGGVPPVLSILTESLSRCSHLDIQVADPARRKIRLHKDIVQVYEPPPSFTA